MAAFNVVKLDVDRARGIIEPKTNAERTPTADAIQMRFKELAGRPVPWPELVEVALRPPDKRPMWLGVLRRDDARADLTDALVAHALQRVAHERGAATVRAMSTPRPSRSSSRPTATCMAMTGCCRRCCRRTIRYSCTAMPTG